MEFNFNLQETENWRRFKIWSFPLFKYSRILSRTFFYLSLFCLLGAILGLWPVAFLLLALILFIPCYQAYLFTELALKKITTKTLLADIPADKKNNIAEFFSFEAFGMAYATIAFCRQRKFSPVTSEAFFYILLKNSPDAQMLICRLGIDPKKFQQDVKNYLEKQDHQARQSLAFSESFQKTIEESLAVAASHASYAIDAGDFLVALSRHDAFFKKTLLEYDLKEEDIENIVAWLKNLEDKTAKSKKFWSKENLSRYGSLGKDFAFGFTVTLDEFSIDWSAIAKRDVFGDIVGHTKELEALEAALAQPEGGNVLMVGDDGVGKKNLIRALAKRCFLCTGLRQLYGKRVAELNVVALLARVDDPEKLEMMIDRIFNEVATAGNIILVIDNLDNVAFLHLQTPGTADMSVVLGKYLSLPNFHVVGIVSYEALHRNLEQHAAFVAQFRKVEISEVSEMETLVILQNLALALEKKYKILITYPAIREIINLTARYFPSLPSPKKATDVLNEVAMRASTKKNALSLGLATLVLPADVARVISEKAEIPLGKMEFKEKSVLLNLENLIHEKIIGQREAVIEISSAMRRSRAGIGSKKRPIGVFLFLGPTGVGKTETAKALAEIYFGPAAKGFDKAKSSDFGERKMIRLDMSEFQAISDIGRLIGQVSPVEEQGLLTTPVRENPFSLVLLDEIEKAHPNILNLFLQIFDEGHITDGQGRKVIFTNTIIICTSNAGADLVFDLVEKGKKVDKDEIFDTLFKEKVFKPEFINRFDAAVFFHALTKEDLLDIAQLNLAALQKNLKEKGIDFIITPGLKEKIAELSYKPEFGAREMQRVVQDRVESVIAQALISDSIIRGDSIEINPEDFSIVKNPPSKT